MNRTAITGVSFDRTSTRSRRQSRILRAAVEPLEARKYLTEAPFDLVKTLTSGAYEGDYIGLELDFINHPNWPSSMPSWINFEAPGWNTTYEEGIDYDWSDSTINAGMIVQDDNDTVTISIYTGIEPDYWYWDPGLSNAPPTAAFNSNSTIAITGQTIMVGFSGQTDPSATDTSAGFTYSFDFNNDDDFDDTGEASGSATSKAFAFNSPGSKVVHGRIADKDGGYNDYYVTISVSDVAAKFSNDGPVSTNSTATVKFSSPFSIDGNESFTYSIDWDNNGTFEVTGSSSPIASTTFASTGVKVVRGRIADSHSNTQDYYTTITVTDTAPSTPTGLAATVISADRIDLTWKKTSNTDAYYIDYATASNFAGATTINTSARVNKWSVTGLAENTTYYFRIRSYNSAGSSSNSSSVNKATPKSLAGRENRSTSLVKDMKTAASSAPDNFVKLNNLLYFTATDSGNGTELWKSDGTSAGTVLVKDINSGSASSSPSDFVVIGSTLFFVANNGSNGRELWKSNGTSTGTAMVLDINAGSGSSSPTALANVNGTLYFAADNGTTGSELWTSNGESTGTALVLDIRSGSSGSSISGITYLSGVGAVFAATEGANGVELWKSNGNSAGTSMIRDIYSGSTGSGPISITAMGSSVYFSADDGTNGRELWGSNGTSTGTALVKSIMSGSGNANPKEFAVHGGRLFFLAEDTFIGDANGDHNRELWVSNGSSTGTKLFYDAFTWFAWSSDPHSVTTTGNILFFTAVNEFSWEMYFTEGTDLVSPTANGWGKARSVEEPLRGSNFGMNPTNYVEANGSYYYMGNDRQHGYELWKIQSGFDNNLMIPAYMPRMLRDINPGSVGAFGNTVEEAKEYPILSVGGVVFFVANDGVHGAELWRTNGTTGGTILVKDINTANSGASASGLTDINGTLYFAADGYDSSGAPVGTELWRSDGTLEGTTLVKDILSGSGSSSPSNITRLGNTSTFLFAADDGTNGTELWKSDGTSAGTEMVKNIRASGSSIPGQLFPVTFGGTDYVLFYADDATNSVGTTLVKDVWAGASGGGAENLEVMTVGGVPHLFFTSQDGTSGIELWKSDGTSTGTQLVKDIYSGSNGSSPSAMTAIGNTLYFVATDGTNGVELWSSNGTSTGTAMLKNINSGASSSSPANLTAIGNLLYFSASDGSNGTELWVSDGTSTGTTLVKDINSGAGSSTPENLLNVDGRFYFSATGSSGRELWVSDGTSTGTTLVSDIKSGASSSSPTGLTNVGDDKLFFLADDGSHGQELWLASGFRLDNETINTTLSGGDVSDRIIDGFKVARYYKQGTSDPQYFDSFTTSGGNWIWEDTGDDVRLIVSITSDDSSRKITATLDNYNGSGLVVTKVDFDLPQIAAYSNADYRTLSAKVGGLEQAWPDLGSLDQSTGWWMGGYDIFGPQAYSPLAAFYDSASEEGVGISAFNSVFDPMLVHWTAADNGITPHVEVQPLAGKGKSGVYSFTQFIADEMPDANSEYYRTNYLAPLMDDIAIAEMVYQKDPEIWALSNAMDTPDETSDDWTDNFLEDGWEPEYEGNSDPVDMTVMDAGPAGIFMWPAYGTGYAFEPYNSEFDWEDDIETMATALGNNNIGVLMNPYIAFEYDGNEIIDEISPSPHLSDPRVRDNWVRELGELAGFGVTTAFWDTGMVPHRDNGTAEDWVDVLYTWAVAGIHVAPEQGNDISSWISGANMHYPGFVDSSPDNTYGRNGNYLWYGGNMAVADVVTPNSTQFIESSGDEVGLRGEVDDQPVFWWDVALSRNMVPVIHWGQHRRDAAGRVTDVVFNSAASPDKIDVSFSKDVEASLETTYVQLINLLDLSSISVVSLSYDSGTNTASFNLSGNLSAGIYRVTVLVADINTGEDTYRLNYWGDNYIFDFEVL